MKFIKRMIIEGALLFLAIYAALACFSLFFANKLVFPHVPPSYKEGTGYIELPVPETGDRLAVRYLPNPRARYVILYAHGNGEDLGHLAGTLQGLQSRGLAVMAYDYPGYGASSGKPTERSVNAATRAVYDYMTQQLDIPPERIIGYGRSVGSGPMVELASRNSRLGGLILDSAFTSTFRVKTGIRIVPWDIFNNSAKMADITCPVLIIHGTDDRVVPFWHAKELLDKTNAPKQFLWVQGGGHNNLTYLLGETYWETLLHFLQLVEVSQAAENPPGS